MYVWKAKTDETIQLTNDEWVRPVATLADKYGGRAQIIVDDDCYVLCLKQESGRYAMVKHWFREAVTVLQQLPSEPKRARLLPFLEWLLGDNFNDDLKEVEVQSATTNYPATHPSGLPTRWA